MLTVALLTLFTLLCVLLSADRAWDNVTKPERNALVFDGRNRAYGAFVLRREYERRFIWAFLGAIGLFAGGITVPKLLGAAGLWSVPPGIPRPSIPDEWVMDIFTTPDLKPADPQPSEPRKAVPPSPTPSDPEVPVVASDSVLSPEPRDTAVTATGPVDPGPIGPGGPGEPGTGPVGGPAGEGPGARFTLDEPGNRGTVDVLPEFPGGEEAMARYIQNNLRVNNEDITEAIEQVIFVIDTDGNVVRVKTRGKSVKEFREAAERVVRAMPKWTPAKYKGQDVPCVMVLPIQYQTR